MNWKEIRWRIRYGLQYVPFTFNTLLCLVAAFAAYKLLYQPTPKEDPAPFRPFIILMGKMAFWFIVVLVGVSILSTIASWLHYVWLKRHKHYQLQVDFTTETKNGKKNKLYLNALLQGVHRPILGFIKGRLFYDGRQLTDKFSLLSNKRKENTIWRAAITGRSRMALPDVKEYQLKGGFIYFEDMLHIFSLAVAQPVSGHFYQPPVLAQDDDRDVFPRKTETLDVRIDQLRRVEGEYLNYKDFESGDDVRRIVWKVYAKNRELVVRIPEMFEPYASHLYFYASFHASVKTQWLNEGYFREMLNYYKNCVWTVYDTLAKKEWELKYVPDQSFNVPEHLSRDERAARIISNSNWHADKSVLQYFNAKQGTVLVISSLTDPDELANTLEQCDAGTVVYFVKLSKVFRHFVAWNWIKRLIFLPPKDRLNKLRGRWVFSPIRLQIQKREKAIEELLRRSNVNSGTL
ncbi:DUF58 domain-containing protein [Polluticoccus soli]|uniref:DUF58 domain-containing protein n=1 Tax=Polluticoccus soli TaxID=3034150 RepID=UPI0023E1B3B4|nr:DUF58 domain-containing protein [Flavipsychrobacter sp. JY13-12]